MRALAQLFGKSPFAPLQEHMERVAECMENLKKIFTVAKEGNMEAVEKLSQVISKLEHQADLTKNDIRNDLPKGMFLPIDRGNLLEILSLQDSLADKAEDIGVLLTFKKLDFTLGFEEKFEEFLDKNMESFDLVHDIIKEMEKLLETSFGGFEATKVLEMVNQVAFLEHEADLLQRELLKILYKEEERLSAGSMIIWGRLFSEVSHISNNSEKLANRVRMTLDLK